MVQRREVPEEVPEVPLSLDGAGEAGLLDVLRQALGVSSNAEARRLVAQGAVRVDGELVKDAALRLPAGSYLIRAGRRRYARVLLA